MKITIYSTTTCPYCKMLKNYLTENGIMFVEKLTDQDQNSQEEMIKLSDGFLGVPFTVIEDANRELHKIVGFDKNKINQILNLK